MIRRVVVIGVIGLVVAALFRMDEPHRLPDAEASPVVGAAYNAASRAATWYCPAAPDATSDVAHQIIVTNPGRKVTVRITGFGTATGSGVAATAVVAAKSQHVVSVKDIAPGLGGVTVEVTGGPVTVAHRLVGAGVEDESDCATEASDRWYFASADTELDRPSGVESGAHLWLLNPFPTDASVDVRVTTDDVVRIPPSLGGIIVPAGSARMVDLGAAVKRHAQFSFAVEARGGRIAAELVQTVNGRGLRLEPGAPATAPGWLIADSFGGTNLSEQLHVYNPSGRDVTVSVSVVPDGYDPASYPEPFVLDIAARRFQTVDLGTEPRVPPDSLRWIRVDTVGGGGVVVSQVMAIAGPGGDGTAATRPAVAGGLASSGGSSAQATTWYITSLSPTTDSQSVVAVANPSSDAISVVTVTKISGGTSSPVAQKLEVPPMGLQLVDVSDATADGPIGVVVTATAPVVVSGRTTSIARSELSTFPALPDPATAEPLPALTGG